MSSTDGEVWCGVTALPDIGIEGLDDWARSESVASYRFLSEDGWTIGGETWIDLDTAAMITLRDTGLEVIAPSGVDDPLDWFGQIMKGNRE